ncbi:S1 RNA-binding domain-containing protein [Streptomyces flavidovirens]|uniref:S1 RNA-binding domain-containing protein n=1 Tax=Streptomyces flavidovirens TaxID=67298 RepID=A0ABW6R8T5_9ACTN
MNEPVVDPVRAFLQTLQPGQVRKGVVRSVTNFGVFVDLGGAVGIITVPNLSWGRISHPAEVTEVGKEVVVTVLSVDLERAQSSLSLKELQHDPFLDFARSRLGSIMSGVVTKVSPIGTFLLLEGGVLGFLPISEIVERGLESRIGDNVTVYVSDINIADRRVILSLRFPAAG